MTLHENYERGTLPYPGSLSEQPAQIIELFQILSSLKQENEMKAQAQRENNGRR